MAEAVLHLPGTLDGTLDFRGQVEEDPDEAAFEDEDVDEEDDWDDLEDTDEIAEIEFDENGDDWDDDLEEDFESYVADAGDDEEEW